MLSSDETVRDRRDPYNLTRGSITVQSYLVEVYVPRSGMRDAGGADPRARAAAEQLAREGLLLRYVRTTYVPDDETCFHVFEAASEEIVREACRRAAFGSPRIVPVME